MANPTNIANANPEPPTPADRVVPIHGWKTQNDQKGDRGQKDKRGGALGSTCSFPGFSSRAVLEWWFDKITHVGKIGAVHQVLHKVFSQSTRVILFNSYPIHCTAIVLLGL